MQACTEAGNKLLFGHVLQNVGDTLYIMLVVSIKQCLFCETTHSGF